MKFYPECAICGDIIYPRTYEYTFYEEVCDKKECLKIMEEYEDKRLTIMRDYAKEKERILRPWKSNMDTELFLLEREYLKGKQ